MLFVKFINTKKNNFPQLLCAVQMWLRFALKFHLFANEYDYYMCDTVFKDKNAIIICRDEKQQQRENKN